MRSFKCVNNFIITFRALSKKSHLRDTKNLLLILTACLLAISGSAQELTWQQLVQHSEMWPAQCHLTHGFDFQSGAKVEPGDTVGVVKILAHQVEVSTLTGKTFAFDVKPDDTDVLKAAQEAYAKLTPKQRALTYQAIYKDKTLWPYYLTLKSAFNLSGGHRINKGDQVIFRGLHGKQLEVAIFNIRSGFDAIPQETDINVDPQDTDLMEQARQFVELPDHAPSRLIAQLQPLLINPTTDDSVRLNTNSLPRYLVFVRAANFCPMSQRFLPKLAEFCDEMKQKHPGFEVIYLSCDQNKPDMETFAKKVGFSWPTVTYKQTSYLYMVVPHLQDLMPQFTVMDLDGNVLISGVGETKNGVVQATSSGGNDKPAPNSISAAAALDQFGALLNKS